MDLLFNFLYLMFSAVFVAGTWWGLLRLMDKGAGISFKNEFKEIAHSDLALSIYFVGRLIATAILLSPLLRVIL